MYKLHSIKSRYLQKYLFRGASFLRNKDDINPIFWANSDSVEVNRVQFWLVEKKDVENDCVRVELRMLMGAIWQKTVTNVAPLHAENLVKFTAMRVIDIRISLSLSRLNRWRVKTLQIKWLINWYCRGRR